MVDEGGGGCINKRKEGTRPCHVEEDHFGLTEGVRAQVWSGTGNPAIRTVTTTTFL